MKVRVNDKDMSQSDFVTGLFLKPKQRVKKKRRKKARKERRDAKSG